jgi:hypothetical protein
MLSGFPALLQVSQNLHVAIEARGAAGEVLRDKWIGFLGVLGQADQISIWRTIDSLWVGEGFGKILLGEAKEFFFVNFLPLFVPHRLA